MTLKPLWYKIIQAVFIVAVIGSVLILGRIAFVMGMSQYVNSKAAEGTYDPAELYYLMQVYTLDFTEPYKAYYNAGTAYAEHEDYDPAEAFLTTSLGKVDYVYSECLIRNNLAYVYEKQGDYYKESDMLDTAQNYYDKAVTTVKEAPTACFPPPPPSGGNGDQENPDSNGGGEGGTDSGEGLPDKEAKPDVSGTGESMKETQDSSQSKSNGIESEKGDPQSAGDQIKDEMEQSKGSYENSQDQSDQQQNQGSPIEKPW